MSANGTLPAPGRNITYFLWRVNSVPDNRTVSSVAGFAGYLKLPVGRYSASLLAIDSRGANSTATRDFVIGSSSNPSNPNANETAVATISLPPPILPQASGSGLTRVVLDASGSAPADGARFSSVLWAVVSLPQRAPVANSTGMVTEVWLVPGDYQVGGWLSCFVFVGWAGGGKGDCQ